MREVDQQLFAAAREGLLEGVESALSLGADVNATDPEGLTPLRAARQTRSANRDVLLRLLLAAADILHGLKLEPNIEKTEIVTFTGGFRFLGTLFVRSIVLPCIKIKTASGQTRYVSGYDSGAKRKRGQQRVQVRRERGHIAVEGPLKERDLQRLVAKAIVDETEGKTTTLGRALLRAWRKELAKSAPAPEAPVDRRATVALLL